jgi:predicted HTH transcriptional regulator
LPSLTHAQSGFGGALFIGVKDDGTVQDAENFESIQRKITRKINEAYPQIYTQQKMLQKSDKTFLAAIILGSTVRPHFTGPAYVRQGSDSVPASEKRFDELIAQRNSKAYAIQRWKGLRITAERRHVERVALVGEVAC